jgi:hypothetical protein
VLISFEWGEAAHSEFGGGVLDSVVTQVSTVTHRDGGGAGRGDRGWFPVRSDGTLLPKVKVGG